MAKGTSTWKVALTCLVITLVILLVFIVVFIVYIMPGSGITTSSIYNVLSRIFPILIGLILIEIAFLIGRRHQNSPMNDVDKLSPNSYDSSLFTQPLDDPDKSEEKLKREKKPSDRSACIDSFNRDYEKEAMRETSSEVIRTMPIEVEKEVIKEVPVEIIREVPVEIVREIYKDGEESLEVPVEVIKEVLVEKEEPKTTSNVSAKDENDEILTFDEALSKELEEANKEGYILSLCSFDKGQENEIKNLDDRLIFTGDEKDYLILPFYKKSEAEREMAGLKGLKVEDSSRGKAKETLLKRV